MTQTATKVSEPVIIEAKVYELPEAGLHTAVITDVTDLGLVKNEIYGTEKRRIRITYTITDEKGKDGTDMKVFESAAASFGPKSRLGARLRGLGIKTDDVQKINLSELIDMEVNVNIVHNKVNDRTYANIDSAARPRRARSLVAVAEEI
jgi:hypothetical protein